MVDLEGQRVTKVSPASDSPFNMGQMCPKGVAAPEIMYHPDRLLHPLKRAGARGSGKWERVSWDEALGEIVVRLRGIQRATGPESIALGQGTGRHHHLHVVRFANQLGTPNWYEPGLANCFIPRISVSNLTYGDFPVADYYGEVNPEVILFWGHNPLVSGSDGELSFPVARALRKGAFGISVDPRRSETARKCKMWLPLQPGTDAALALAMIHTIIFEELYDKQFVADWTVGFEALKAHVLDFTPEWAAAICGVPAEDIVETSRRYAMARPAILEWGVAIEQNPNSLQTVRALAILRALTGNLDVPGGDVFGMHILNPYPTLRHALPKGMIKKRIGADQFKLLGGFKAYMPSAHIPGLFQAMRTGVPYPVEGLMIFGNNPLATVANPRGVHEALMKLKLLVVTDLFMTPTAALADYVLPAAYWPEINQLMDMPMVAENAVFANQKVAQVGECRQDEEIMIDLARRLNLPGCGESLEDLLDHRLEPLGVSFSDLKERPFIVPTFKYQKYKEKGFRTPSRKVELFSKSLQRLKYDPLPTYKPQPESPEGSPSIAKTYPYVLTTGARRRGFFHSEHRQIASLRKLHPVPVAEMHPATASNHGILDGDPIYVRSPRGKIRMRAKVSEDIKAGVVSIDHGWWFPEKHAPDFGVWESNANLLTSDAPPYDPAFGSYQMRGLLCSVELADQADDKGIHSPREKA